MSDDDEKSSSSSSSEAGGGRKRDREQKLCKEDVCKAKRRLMRTISEYIVFRDEACLPTAHSSEARDIFGANRRVKRIGKNMNVGGMQSMNGRSYASIWVPREAYRTTPVFMGDMKSQYELDVYRTMIRMLVYFASVLFDNESSTCRPYFSVAFWYDRTMSTRNADELARMTGDIFSRVYSGVTISVCTGQSDQTGATPSRDQVSDAFEILQTHLDNVGYKENKPQRSRGRRGRGKSAQSGSKSSGDHDNMVVVDGIESMGKTTVKQIVNSYLRMIPERDGDRRSIYLNGCESWLASKTCSRLCVMSARPAQGSTCVALVCNVKKTMSSERDLLNMVLPHVSTPIDNFLDKVQAALSKKVVDESQEASRQRTSAGAAKVRADMFGSNASGSSSSAARYDEMRDTTIERRLFTLNKRLKMQVGEIAGTFGGDVKAEIESGVRRLMFNLYCSVARGADDTMSIVGESMHKARIGEGIDALNPFSLRHYGTAMGDSSSVHFQLKTAGPYDSFRHSVLYDIVSVAGFRPENAFLQHFMQETASSAFDDSAKLKPNIIIYGDGGSGKDFLLEHLEEVFVDGTVIKESRATERADATVCHGKRDGQLVYSPELDLSPFLKLKSRGGAGDSNKKDLMTSGKIYTRVFCFDPETGERTTKLVKHERYVLCYEAMNPSVISKMDEALVQRYLWIGLPPLTMQTNLQILEAVYTQRVKHTTELDKMRKAAYINCQQFMQLATFEVYKMILCGCIREVSTEGAYFIMFECVSKILAKNNPRYGCWPPIQRKINQIISIAKGHAIRRAIVENFMTSEGRFYGRSLTPIRLSALPYFVSLSDIALSLGQVGDYIGIFQDGEVQVIMALRYMWITNKMRYTMFRCDMDTFGEPNPSYVRFPGNLRAVARQCSQVLALICSVENRAPRLITQDMIYDTLQRLTRSSSAATQLPTVSVEDDCVEFTPNYNAMFRNISESDDESEAKKSAARHRNRFDYFDSREKRLVPCLAVDRRRRESIDKSAPLPPIQAIVRRDDRCVDVHVAYLSRLFDPHKQYWPWSDEKPSKWSPMIDEHTLLTHCLESVRSYRYQCSSPNMVYRMDYREMEEVRRRNSSDISEGDSIDSDKDEEQESQSSSSSSSNSATHTRYDFDFDFVRRNRTTTSRRLRVPLYGGDDQQRSGSSARADSVLLHASVDEVSMLSTRVGWNKALMVASSEQRWREAKQRSDFPSRFGRRRSAARNNQ